MTTLLSNILKINADILCGDRFTEGDDLFGVVGVQSNWPSIHSGELFKQNRFALHDRHCGLRTNVAQSQHGAAIGYHRYGIALDGEVSSIGFIFGDRLADPSDSWRIGPGEVIAVAQWHLGFRFEFAAQVHKKGAVRNISNGSAFQRIYGFANFVTVCPVANIARYI